MRDYDDDDQASGLLEPSDTTETRETLKKDLQVHEVLEISLIDLANELLDEAHAFERMGKAEEAHKLYVKANILYQKAAGEGARVLLDEVELSDLFEEDADRLAVTIQHAQKQELVSISTAVSTLTRAVRGISVDQLAEATDGDQETARELKETTTFWGVMIKHTLTRAIPTLDEARHLVQQLVEFVAAILTIADHIAPIFNLFKQFESVLAPFVM
jgi:hypothetical protein